jgi:alpha-beta hydrolase superfamily lysophospholipase
MSAASSTRRTYAELSHWRSYQQFLPEPLRTTPDREPVEDWWSWRSSHIHLDRYVATDAPATVLLLHGGGGCGRLLAPFGQMLHRRGYEVVAPDLPGYGLSTITPELFTYHAWVDCVVDLVAAEKRRTGRPVVLFGMSIGGYLAYMATAKGRNVDGVVATTLADPRLAIVRDQFARHPRMNRLLTPFLPYVTALGAGVRLPLKWFANMQALCNTPEVNQLVTSDPAAAAMRSPLRFMNSLFTVTPAIEPERFDACPVLLTQPAADRWTTLAASQPFFDRIRGPKKLVMLDNCGHFPIEAPGINQLDCALQAFLSRIVRANCPPTSAELAETAPFPSPQPPVAA